MLVYKFGGASVRDALSVKRISDIIRKADDGQLFIVISAMGKTTNQLEKILQEKLSGEQKKVELSIQNLLDYHHSLALELFKDPSHIVFQDIRKKINYLKDFLNNKAGLNFDSDYDQVVSVGELLSTCIVSSYLNDLGIENTLVDARDIIITNDKFKNAEVIWDLTELKINNIIHSENSRIWITQGFIGSTINGQTTTLGREGSDYTAAIISFCSDASNLTIWKDVPGVYNADPHVFSDAVLLPEISYYDAIEMTYYGATVIHPKTIKPLQNKKIPLHVKSFLNPSGHGTIIRESFHEQKIPTYIQKHDQVLITFTPHDFSFIAEHNLSVIFESLNSLNLRVNLMQLSALNFSVCTVAEIKSLEILLKKLGSKFRIKYNLHCSLLTIRNYNDKLINELTADREILLEQRSRNTIQVVIRD